MERRNYPSNLLVKLKLNAFGVPYNIVSIKDDKGENIYEGFSSDERVALASGADEVFFLGITYRKGKPTRASDIGHSLTVPYRRK